MLAVARIATMLALRRAPAAVKRQAEDVCQEACIGALRAARRYEAGRGASYTTFAKPAAFGCAIDSYRRNRYPRPEDEITPAIEKRHFRWEPEEDCDIRPVLLAIRRLPRPQGRIIILHHLRELPKREIARRLDISTFAAERHYREGMEALKAEILMRYRIEDFLP